MTTARDVCEVLRASVLARLDAIGSDPISTTYSGIGIVPWDDCCGQLVVTPERHFESIVWPQEYAGEERCDDTLVATELIIELIRCVPVPDQQGNPPTSEAIDAAHTSILADAHQVWLAMHDPFVDDEWERAQPRQRFVGSEGGCIAVESRLLVGVPHFQWDES